MAAKKASGAVRRFELVEGSSAKFWEVSASGAELTVRFGRLGTDGQTKAKKLASPAAAEQERDKLIREKRAKGYRETGSTSATPAPLAAKPPRPTLAGPSSAALVNGDKAAGARYVRPGFAFEPSHDLEFALGFPHFRTLVDGDPDDAKVAANTKALFKGIDGLSARLTFPRGIAMALARVGASPKVRLHIWGPDADKLVARKDPIDRDEAKKMLTALLRAREPVTPAAHTVVFIVEAAIGPDAVAELVVDAAEGLEKPPHFGANVLRQLGFVLLRVEAKRAQSLRERLEGVFTKWARVTFGSTELPPHRGSERTGALRSLDLILHGRLGAERSLLRVQEGLDIHGVEHVLDDREFVAQIVLQEMKYPSAMRVFPDARLAFLGGPAVVDHYRRRLATVKLAADHKYVVETFGRIRDESVVRLMLTMSATSRARKEATEWLRAHADYATPVLRAIAREPGPEAAWAEAAAKGQ